MNRTNYLKLIPLMLLTVFLLSGCVSLQDLRDDHAVFTDTSKKEIIWQGRKYLYLTDSSESHFSPEYDDGYINVTDKEVPVLMAGVEGDYGEVSKDGNFIALYESVYCLEEAYEEMKLMIENPPELNCFAYQYYDKDDMHFEVLNLDTTKQLKDILKVSTVEKKDMDYMSVAEIYQCSKDGLYNTYSGIAFCMNSEGQYFWEIWDEEDYHIYEVPEEYRDILEELFEDAIDVANEYMEYYDYEEYEEF